jgi:Domain of unknown function (DUF4158)
MPVYWLTAADRDRLLRFPQNMSETDLISFFTLTKEDQRFVKRHYGAGQLGVALQLCALRFLGFIPEDLESAPEAAIEFLTRQLEIPIETLDDYGKRKRTRSDHAGEIERYLGAGYSSSLNNLLFHMPGMIPKIHSYKTAATR